jgi:formate-dependent nitrite reductase cytochrome c552 subunit
MKTTEQCRYCARPSYVEPNGRRFSTCLRRECLRKRSEEFAATRPVTITCVSCGNAVETTADGAEFLESLRT